jgi:ribosomal protein S15P/S13E
MDEWDTPFASKSAAFNIAEYTDCMVGQVASLGSSLISDDCTPNFDDLAEKSLQDPTISHLKNQIVALTQKNSKLHESVQKLRQELESQAQMHSEIEEKYQSLLDFLKQSDEDK